MIADNYGPSTAPTSTSTGSSSPSAAAPPGTSPANPEQHPHVPAHADTTNTDMHDDDHGTPGDYDDAHQIPMGPPMSAEMGIDMETDALFHACDTNLTDHINNLHDDDPDLLRKLMDTINNHIPPLIRLHCVLTGYRLK